MPKILQRTLLILITRYFISILLYYMFYIITNIIIGNRNNFWGEKDIMLFFSIIILEFFDTSIPDYIFIAPFSKKERIELQKKLFLYSHFAVWIIISVFITFPGLITAVINSNLQNIFKYIFKIAIICPMIFTAGHFRYFNLLNKKHFKNMLEFYSDYETRTEQKISKTKVRQI